MTEGFHQLEQLEPEFIEPSSDDADFQDSFLRAVAHGPALLREPSVGERLGGGDGQRFEILSPLGGGGMGRVYRAQDAELQRVVALKFLLPREDGGEQGSVAWLRQEARALARLDHEHIIRVFDVSEWAGEPWEPRIPFLVMECLEGESLAALLRREPRLGVRRALAILQAVATGLAHAHGRHIVHRDLKPSNVFIGPSGRVTLLDFGLAWSHTTGAALPWLPTAGTPSYMSPEQWRGGAQDARGDLWSAGVLLHEMLTGELPYAEPRLDVLRAHITSPEPVPRVRVRHPELPEEVEALVASLLEKEPGARLPSAAVLLERTRQLTERLGPWSEAARSPGPQRRSVTLVSCRLGGGAGLGAGVDPEDLDEMEAAFQQRCAEIIQAQGGTLTSCMGSEVLACFGHPVAHEDDAERAVEAGLKLASSSPPVRVGLHTETVVMDDGPPRTPGGTPSLQGEAPRVAGGLAQSAPAGAVVLSDATASLVRQAFELQPLAPLAFEDLSGPRPLRPWRVGRARAEVLRIERRLALEGLSPLVGRERELDEVLGVWREAREGHGALVLLSGEAGLGKSRLMREVLQRVAPSSCFLLRCQCWSQFAHSAYHPLIDLLHRLFRLDPESAPAAQRHTLDAHLEASGLGAEQREWIAALLSLPAGHDAPFPPLAPEQRKERTHEALLALLFNLARQRPVLAVVEDLHWADPSTRELLDGVLARVGEERVLVLASTRHAEDRRPWPRGLPLRRVELERLSAPLTARLAREAAGDALSEEMVRLLVEKTDGVPLFVEELARQVAVDGVAPVLPLTLRGLLHARLDALPERLKALARLCAVVGRSFSLALLAPLTERAPDALGADLEALVAAGLLQSVDGEPPAYQFRHALFQEAAYQSLPRGPRRQHHRWIAQALEERFPEVARSEPELLAHHYTEAGAVAPALEYWARAGLRAGLRSANVEAVSHLRHALELLATQPDTPQRAQMELRLLTALGLPLSQTRGLSHPEVKRAHARMRELFPQVGDALPGLELSYWGPFAYSYSRAEFREAQALGEQLADVGARQHDRELLALGHRMQATILFTWGRMREALELGERAVACSSFSLEEQQRLCVRHWVDPTAVALAHTAVILTVIDRSPEAEDKVREALRLADALGHPRTRAYVLLYAAVACQMRGDAPGTLRLAEACLALARENRVHLLVEWVTWSSLLRAWALAELGLEEAALEQLRRGLGRWRLAGLRAGLPYHVGLLASVHLRRERPEEALRAVHEALAWARAEGERFYVSELHRLGALAWRALGEEARARESLERAVRLAHEQGAALFERRARTLLEPRLRGEAAREEEHHDGG